jgi:hypothetical protein
VNVRRVVIVDGDLVRRALVQCALPEGLEAAYASQLDEVGDAEVALIGQVPGLSVAEVCRSLRKRMALVLIDERYADAELAQREVSAYGAGAFVAPPFSRETIAQAVADAAAKSARVLEAQAVVDTAPTAEREFAPQPTDVGQTKSAEQMWEAFRTRVDTIYRNLDRLSHYQVLEISAHSSEQQIKLAYQMRVMEFHPDRFASHPNEDFRRKLYEITKAVTEALRVLSDTKRRQAYDAEHRPRERTGRRPPKKETP